MNAYELADKLQELDAKLHLIVLFKSAEMLRQQADRIAELEKKGEPVAWMEYIQDEEWEVWYTEPTDLPEGHSYKPLYLAPQTKPLSDEEIHELANEHLRTQNQDGAKVVLGLEDFARAIEEAHGIK